jgi:hypothetical protein
MTRTVADRMVESAGRGWVGARAGGRRAAGGGDRRRAPFLVALVHGPGGHRQDHVVGVARQAGFTRRERVCGTPFNDVYAVRP